MTFGSRIGAAVALALAATTLVACGSDGGSDADSASAPKPTAAKPTGSEIKIMTIAVKSNPVLTQSQQFAAAQAKVDYINDSGGINGHPLTLIQCDSNLDPNQEGACFDQAIKEKVSAITGSTVLFASDLSALAAAKIPMVGTQGLVPAELGYEYGYTFGNNINWFKGLAATAVSDGLKKVAITFTDTDAGKFSGDLMTAGLEAGNVDITESLAHAPTGGDRSAEAATLTKDDPEAILFSGTSEAVVPLMQAVRQSGYTGELYTISPDLTPSGIKALGAAGDGIHVIGRGRFLTDSSEKIQQYKDDIANYAPSDTDMDENGTLGWSGVDLFATVMAKADSFTGADVIKQMDALTEPVEAGTFGPFVGAGTGCDPDFPKLLNTNFIVGTLKDGEITANTGDFQSYC
ncbi:hypothetical protein GCM10023350_42830 [Nocardioides endophyticus]|uniref:Leucine-binding protein domain-containing protein n=1 Tax=Nocardioides endophyticus TaxID=1353775 RepID=A0ABP8ZCU4_9ACTN